MKKNRKSVSVRWLQLQGACAEQVRIVREEWGEKRIPLTRKNLLRAGELALNIDWLADVVLTYESLAEYKCQCATILAEYNCQLAPILAEYERQRDAIWSEYKRQHAPILAEYKRQYAPISAEYKRQLAPILAEYKRQCAPILASTLEAA